jgi:hypothetical protein
MDSDYPFGIFKLVFYKGQPKPVYEGHSREPENVPFMSSCPLYTQVKDINTIHYWEKSGCPL